MTTQPALTADYPSHRSEIGRSGQQLLGGIEAYPHEALGLAGGTGQYVLGFRLVHKKFSNPAPGMEAECALTALVGF